MYSEPLQSGLVPELSLLPWPWCLLPAAAALCSPFPTQQQQLLGFRRVLFPFNAPFKILLCYGSAHVSHLGACKPRGAQICRRTCCFKLMSGWSSASMMSRVFSDARDPILVTIFSVIPSPLQLSVCKRDYGRRSREVLGTIVASVRKEAIRE